MLRHSKSNTLLIGSRVRDSNPPDVALQVSFMQELGGDNEVNSSAEARKMSFYLFWNIKPYFDRCIIP